MFLKKKNNILDMIRLISDGEVVKKMVPGSLMWENVASFPAATKSHFSNTWTSGSCIQTAESLFTFFFPACI